MKQLTKYRESQDVLRHELKNIEKWEKEQKDIFSGKKSADGLLCCWIG